MQLTHQTLPLDEASARSLRLGDMVTLDGEIVVTAGIPTHQRILDYMHRGEELPMKLEGAAFFHLGSFCEHNGDAYKIHYLNPTTSTRFNTMMPEIIRHFGLRCIGGKGGLNDECAAALRDVGGVYLSFLGGGSPLLSAAVQRIVSVAWEDMIEHYRPVTLQVSGLGPLTVAIDAEGNSLYSQLSRAAVEKETGKTARTGAAPAAGPQET